jgi:large subunit ribosomal protein L19
MTKEFENIIAARLKDGRTLPEFSPGDTLRVNIKIKDGTTERLQAYQGICIARMNKGPDSHFTVRKISNGIGVERRFPLHAPLIASVDVLRRGAVKRAKLYYLRPLRGKAIRIEEKVDFERASQPQLELQ